MKSEIVNTRKGINRATSFIFPVLIFGALGAGLIGGIQNIFGLSHIVGSFETTLWFISFWCTDFFYVLFSAVLAYCIAGLPGIAPASVIALYFANFAGGTPVSGDGMYSAFFSTPVSGGGGANIGFMSYLILTVLCSLLIKYLFIFWAWAKTALGKKLNRLAAWAGKKFSLVKDGETLSGEALLENLDLVVLFLIMPIIGAIITVLVGKYLILAPVTALAGMFEDTLTTLSASGVIITAVIMGLAVGFDIIGPFSMAALGVSVAALAEGNAQLLTIYAACLVTTGWVPLAAHLLQSALFKKKGTHMPDTDGFNLATSGPINAFFENMKLTVVFTMPIAYRSPLSVIPGVMCGSAFSGFLTALFGIVNQSYVTATPKYGNADTYLELLRRGEMYISFTLPLRSGTWLGNRIPLFFIVLAGAAVGGLLTAVLRHVLTRHQAKIGTLCETNDDMAHEWRLLAAKFRKEYLANKATGYGVMETEKSDAAEASHL